MFVIPKTEGAREWELIDEKVPEELVASPHA